MKNLTLSILASVLFIACSTPVKRDETVMSNTEVSQIVSSANFSAFKMKVDSIEYIIARTPNGIAIIKHSK